MSITVQPPSPFNYFRRSIKYGGVSRHSGLDPESRVFNWSVAQRCT